MRAEKLLKMKGINNPNDFAAKFGGAKGLDAFNSIDDLVAADAKDILAVIALELGDYYAAKNKN